MFRSIEYAFCSRNKRQDMLVFPAFRFAKMTIMRKVKILRNGHFIEFIPHNRNDVVSTPSRRIRSEGNSVGIPR
jgi:hypothetical protein